MRILIDGDACPVTHLVEKIAARYGVGVVFFTAHAIVAAIPMDLWKK